MSLNFNRVFISGRLTRDIEVRTTAQTQKFVCSFDIAVNTAKDVTYFIPCVAWEKKAEFLATHFRKGAPIFVEGELQSRKFTDKDNKERTTYEVKVIEVKFCETLDERTQREGVPTEPQEEEYIPVPTDSGDDLPF